MKPRILVVIVFVAVFAGAVPGVGMLRVVSAVPAARAESGTGAAGSRASAVSTGAPQEEKEKEEREPPQREPLRYEERITVTANRLEENVRDVGSSVTVITAEEIEASGALWLIDVLERAPGVSVVRNGGPGTVTTVFLRGTNSNQTLFLVNGVRVNSPGTGSYDLSHFATQDIERIEIVRGPQSPLYGSEALGGVIHVITKRGSGPTSGGIEADGGSFSTGRLRAWIGGQEGAVDYSVGLGYFDSGGFSAAAEERGNAEADGYRNVTLDARAGYSSDSGITAEGFVRTFDSTTDIDGFGFGVGPIDDPNAINDRRDTYVGLGFGYEGASWTTKIAFSDTEIDFDETDPDGFFTRFGLDASVRGIDWKTVFDLPANNTLIGGVEYRKERAKVVSESLFGESGFDAEIDVAAVYLHDRIEVADGVVFTAGGRYNDHSTYGGKATFRVTGSAELGRAARLHGSVGSAFRAPSLNELFFPIFGNLTLEPEESVGIDFGIELDGLDKVLVDVTYFRNDIDQLIDFGLFGFVNIGEALSQGVEFAGDWYPHDRLMLSGNYTYTYTDAVDESTGEQLLRRPRHQGAVRATLYPLSRLRLFAEFRSKGERFDFGPTGRVALDAYALFNVAGDFEANETFLIRGRVDNLFDQEYEEIFGFGTAGVSGYIGAVVRFGRRP